MTSVGVISSAVERIKRLKEVQQKDHQETPFDDHGVLEHLEKIKELLVTAYKERTEERAEVEIKKVVRLSYEIVDVFVVDLFRPVKTGTKKLKELVEKLAGVQSELTKKIRPEISDPSEIIASPEAESSTDSPRSKMAARENKPKGGNIFGIQTGSALATVEKHALATVGKIKNIMTPKNQKSATGSDSDPLVGSKPPVLEQSTTGSDSDPLVRSKAPILEQSITGSDSDPIVGSKAPVLEQSTINSESQVENLEISIGSDTHVENIKQKSLGIAGSRTLTENKAAGLEQKPEIGSTGSSEIQIQEEENRISLMGRIKTDLISELPKDRPREVYIVGKSGMGKTTLARKLYNDPDIQNKFKVSGWVTIGQNFQIKGVLQLLLQQLQGGQHERQADLREMNEMELIVQIFSVVQNKSYLLVLHDVGSVKDWESICLALPLANSTRVIITTSSDEFLSCANSYELSCLTESETLALLNKPSLLNKQTTIFRPDIGKAIRDITGGSPLYTRILGRSLESEAKDPDHGLVAELVSYKSKKGTPQLLDASYRRLAPELKPCFLYLGLFPPAQHIQVDKLYLLLSAENLISSPSDSEIPLPESFKKCMDKLAGLKLVKVEEDELVSRTGFHKSCILHDQVQDYCKSKGLDEEFLEVVDFKSSEQVVGPETRRLAVYMRNYRGESSISFKGDASVKKILSLLVFDAFESGQGKSEWPSEISDLAGFTSVRVLNFEEVDFRVRKLPKGVEKLILLRFLSFRGCFLEELPSSLSKLTQLETLDLLVQDDCYVTIPDNIFTNMTRMVHLFLPRLYQGKAKTTKLTLLGLEMMETLVNFDTEVFHVEDLCQLKKLRILSTISNGDYPEHVEAVINLLNERRDAELQHSSMEIRNFDCYNGASISALKKLLQCRFVNSVQIEGEIGELPEEEDSSKCDERLVSEMVLRGSELEDDPMDYFGRFQKLRSLVLAEDAFMGTQILISSSALFPKLRSLKLRNLQYLEKLTIEEGALPELSSLQIESCGDALVLTIPKELHDRLKKNVQTRGDAYSVVPSPSILNITITPTPGN